MGACYMYALATPPCVTPTAFAFIDAYGVSHTGRCVCNTTDTLSPSPPVDATPPAVGAVALSFDMVEAVGARVGWAPATLAVRHRRMGDPL